MWSDVDREEKVVRLRAANSKNSYGRILPIEGELAEIIERRWQARKMTQSDGAILLARHVFHRGKDKPIRDVRDVWKKACAEVGLLDLLVHDLRRSGIRNMTRAGVPECRSPWPCASVATVRKPRSCVTTFALRKTSATRCVGLRRT